MENSAETELDSLILEGNRDEIMRRIPLLYYELINRISDLYDIPVMQMHSIAIGPDSYSVTPLGLPNSSRKWLLNYYRSNRLVEIPNILEKLIVIYYDNVFYLQRQQLQGTDTNHDIFDQETPLQVTRFALIEQILHHSSEYPDVRSVLYERLIALLPNRMLIPELQTRHHSDRIPAVINQALDEFEKSSQIMQSVPKDIEKDCPICQNSIHNSIENKPCDGFADVIRTRCKHYFHRDCIRNWICRKGFSATCPMCRGNFFR